MTSAYATAATVEEALAELAAGARPVAGGTDLVVGDRQGKAPLPDRVVAIHRIESLRGMAAQDGGLRIGALVTHSELVADQAVCARYPALADASAIVGSHATRNMGTLGGNVMNASPAMETGGPLVCLGASVVLAGPGGERRVPVAELFAGPGRTTASPDELLVAVELPDPGEDASSAYVRLEYRRQMEIAVVGATCALRLEGGRVAGSAVAITALAPIIHRVPEAEAALDGSDGGDAAIAAAAAATAAAARPISDVRASERYRRAMAEVMARRAMAGALARARGESVPIPASQSLVGA